MPKSIDKAHTVDDGMFWQKVRKVMGKVPFVLDAVAMYYCMVDPETPLWVKAQIAGAIAYFICPVDLLPDFLVPLGYTDDAAVIAACLTIVRSYVTDAHWTKAKNVLFVDPG